jgi:hypothetical protein
VVITKCPIACLTIDILSDDVLLYIFNLYRPALKYFVGSWALNNFVPDMDTWQWRTLADVCQRWRHIIFAWPSQLDVRVECKSVTDIVKVMNAWPTLPIGIWSKLDDKVPDGDEIIAGLKHRDRLAAIKLSGLTKSQLERCTTLMQESFPILRTLALRCHAEIPPVLTDAFLGGSAPCLRRLHLVHVPFPSLPSLLSTASNLVDLHLEDIPSTGYISPDMMATCLSMLPKLNCVRIIFQSQRSFPSLRNRCPPPAARVVLPALIVFEFKGLSEYSEDLMARINAPHLNHLSLEYFYQPILDIPQVLHFIHHTKRLKRPNSAHIDFYENSLSFWVRSSRSAGCGRSSLVIQCTGVDKQISLLEQICTQCSPVLSDVEELDLLETSSLIFWPQLDEQIDARLLEALRVFDAVEEIIIDGDELLMEVAYALDTVTPERAAEVLPMLQTIFGRSKHGMPEVNDAMRQFLNARWETDHPVDMEWVNI